MATPTPTTAAEILQNQNTTTINSNNNNNKNEVSREEIQAAIAKAVELRALHAALMQNNNNSSSPAANLRFSSSASPASHHVSQFSAHDYPVFTPSYEDEPLPGYQQLQLESQTLSLSQCWDDEYGGTNNASSRKGISSEFLNHLVAETPQHICPTHQQEDHKSITLLKSSPGGATTDFYKSSRRNSLGDFNSISSCNKCNPAVLISTARAAENAPPKNCKNSNIVVPLTDSHASSIQAQAKSRGLGFMRVFGRLRKKYHKNGNSPQRTEPEEEEEVASRAFKDWGIMSVEALRREVMEANESKDAALVEVAEMRSSVGELRQKLEYLETYCEELKKALRQAVQAKESQVPERLANFPRRGKSIDGNAGENAMPVSEEVMVEGFLQMVSEARLSVKQFSKTLVGQIEESDGTLMDNLNVLLQPYKLSLNSRYSKAVLSHLEAIINQSLYQDFENSVFQKNGSPKFLDPQQDRQAQFSSFVALRNLSWNEVLQKGTRFYSEEFSKFCDQKMSFIITTLSWTRPWPEQLLQSFFVAAKCVWLLHLLAFSFNPPLGILRVDENRGFDSHYMEDIFVDRQRSHGPSRVKIMVMPGFYVQDRILRCKVLCRYRSIA